MMGDPVIHVFPSQQLSLIFCLLAWSLRENPMRRKIIMKASAELYLTTQILDYPWKQKEANYQTREYD